MEERPENWNPLRRSRMYIPDKVRDRFKGRLKGYHHIKAELTHWSREVKGDPESGLRPGKIRLYITYGKGNDRKEIPLATFENQIFSPSHHQYAAKEARRIMKDVDFLERVIRANLDGLTVLVTE